jgi:rhamnogalacturonan endolyase
LLAGLAPAPALHAARVMERLDRGVIAVHQPDGRVYISWRLFGTDAPGTAFNVYRTTAAGPAPTPTYGQNHPDPITGTVRLNAAPLNGPTWWIDDAAHLERATGYFVRPVVAGVEGPASPAFTLAADAPPLPYVSLPLQTPPGYTPGDASVGDLDGDGQYEIILKQEQTPRDNSQPGPTGDTLLQAYRLDGSLLWPIHLGKNIREGAHYTQFMVYDLDSDGRAEVACKTADGTIDGTGKVIGDPTADWRNAAGHILRGPEYLTIFDGRTGAALATTAYVPGRAPDTENPSDAELKAVWGDAHANRSDRYLACVAYLDGARPSLVMCRGYYTRTVLAAWDWRGGKLAQRWVFDSDASPANRAYRGQGNHNLSVADVDGDGRDEIIYGAMVVDDDGRGLYSTGWGHGDALHVGDLVPDNPGLEVCDIQERFDREGLSMRDARTGRPIFLIPSVKAATSGGDKGEGPGRGNSFNIDPRYPGAESWAAGAGMDGIYDDHGHLILAHRPHGFPCNFGILWDGDYLHELLDQNRIMKWDWRTEKLDPLLIAHACAANNGTKATPALTCDLWGDWREEVVWRTRDNHELRIYTSTIPTKHRLFTLMHDPQYRLSVAWQNVAYNQPPHPGFYLDESAPPPPRPDIVYPESDPTQP